MTSDFIKTVKDYNLYQAKKFQENKNDKAINMEN